jgi:coiled-coil domain-containing protein 77
LRPSRELLEYYRKKIGEYDIEREDIMKKIDKFKNALEDQVKPLYRPEKRISFNILQFHGFFLM